MIKVNLLASEAVKKEERQEIMILAYIVIGLIVVAGLGKYGLKFRSLKKVEKRIEHSKSELKKYQSIVNQVETLKSTKKVLETKKNVIKTLMSARLIYPTLMENLLNTIPNNVWLKTMNTKILSGNKTNVKLSAESLDNYSIADFITSLSSDKNFVDVELGQITTAAKQKDKQQTSNFQIQFNYRNESQK